MIRAARISAALALLLSAGMASVRAGADKPHPALGGKACDGCHGEMLKRGELHAPVKEKQCETCHEVPAAGGKAGLTDKVEALCFLCHEKEKLAAGNVHGPVAVGGCVACHDAHGNGRKHMVLSEGAELCLGCHEDMKPQLAAAKFRHKALEAGCTPCHSPHSSPRKYFLKAETGVMCGKCHEGVMKAAAGPVKHSAVKEGQSCLNCHGPHVAETRPQLKADGATTCLKCHDRPQQAGGVMLADMKALLAENPDHHGPIREKDCSGCHSPHGGEHFRLLKDDYPKEFYAPFRAENFSLCFQCHDAGLPRDEKTTTLTDFRDGDRNLHFVHVNKTPKGRTCRACHETHASISPNHIRRSVPFGKWPLPLNFAKNTTGGTCTPGCHAQLSYDRKKTSPQQNR